MTDTALEEVCYRRGIEERFARIDSWLADKFRQAGSVYPPCGMVEVNEDVARQERWRSVLQGDDAPGRDGTDKEDRLPDGVLP